MLRVLTFLVQFSLLVVLMARQEPERAKNAVSFSQAQELLKLPIADLEDAIAVLGSGDLYPEAVMKLKEALAIDVIA